jgi:hypothetical protein
MKRVVNNGLDIEDELYATRTASISVSDVIYGYGIEIEQSGNDFFAHKTGFTNKSLALRLNASGFPAVITSFLELQIMALAFKTWPNDYARELFGLYDK